MATTIFFSIAFLMVLSPPEGIVVNCDSDNCDIGGNVSLSSHHEFCPSQPVTVQCNVTKPQDGAQLLLSWECQDTSDTIIVLCNHGRVAQTVSCPFGEIDGAEGDCICNGTVIKSEVTFNTTSMCDMKLFCSNGGAERQHVSVTIDGLNAPVLLDNNTEGVKMDNGTYEVTVWWTKGNCTPDDVEYNLTLTVASSEEALNKVTKQTRTTLYLNPGIEYVIAVTAQLCGGDLKSETSNERTLNISVTPTTITPGATITPTTITPGATMTSNPADSSDSTVVFAVIGVLPVLVLGVVVVFIILCFWIRKKKEREVVNSPISRSGIAGLSGEETEEEVDSPAIKRSGIAGLYVDTEHIYYSCTEVNETTNEKKYILRKCKYNGELVKTFRCNSFVRGIGQSHDFIYVLCSAADSKVVKLNRNLGFVKGTSDDRGKDFGEAFGMLVTSDNVLVYSKRNKIICVLDLNLEPCFNFKLEFGPIGIAKFKNNYVVTAKAAIGLIDVDFEKRGLKVFGSMIKGEDSVPFKPNIVFRGVCCSDEYIYVTREAENDGPGLPMLCLQFDEKEHKLNYVCEVTDFSTNCDEKNEKCGPVIPFYHNNTMFYSQGSFGIKFHIIKATHNPGEPIESNKIFDVC